MGKKLTQEQFVKKAREVHGDKYDYSKSEYANSNIKVCIICPEHGEFWQTPLVHLYGNGCGCRECRKKSLNEKFKFDVETFVEKAKKIHGDKYDYSKVIYVNSHTPVTIVCPEHGEFQQEPYSHLNGRGCYKCGRISSGKKASKRRKSNTKDFIQKSVKIHGDRYDYSKVEYVNNHERVCIICPEHGEFWQSPSVHLKGSGCPACKESLLENEVYRFLKEKGVNFIREKTFTWLKFKGSMFLDFFLPDQNIAIECQGIQHFVPTSFGCAGTDEEKRKKLLLTKKRDAEKKKLCEEHGIKVFYFFHNNYFLDTSIYNSNNTFKNINDIRL